MKTKGLIELLERNGWQFKRHGANHDIYVKNGQRESVVRHREPMKSWQKQSSRDAG